MHNLSVKKGFALILPCLVFITMQVVFQSSQLHSILNLESLALFSVLVFVGVWAGVLLEFKNRMVSSIVIGALFSIFLNFIVSIEYSEIRMRHSVPFYFLIGFSIHWFMGGKLLVIISSGLIAVLLSTLLLPSEKPWKENTFKLAKTVLPSNYRSPILHIILDGHLGLAAFPRQIEGVERLKKRIEGIYKQYGFKVYSHAFSRHNYTQNSIPEILNLKEIKIDKSYIKTDPKRGFVLKKSAVFEQYRKHGYELNVFQTDVMDFCSLGYFSYCLTAPYRNLAWLSKSGFDFSTKFFVLASAFLNQSNLFRWFERYVLARWNIAAHPKSFPPVNMVEMFKRISRSTDLIKPGTVSLAHVLLPHEPYALDELCNLRPISEWYPQNLIKDQESYFAQMNCTYTLLEELFESIRNNQSAKDAIIIVHGDHGSRIAHKEKYAKLYTYSTLFAVRHPNLPANVLSDEESTTTLFSKHVLEYLGLNDGKKFRNNSIMKIKEAGGELVEDSALKF